MERTRVGTRAKSPEKRARIGERIKIAATSAGLTLKELAERVGTTPALIYQYVRGITNIPPETLKRIAATTQVTLEFFDPDKDARYAFAFREPGSQDAALAQSAARAADEVKHLEQLAAAYDAPRRNVPALLSVLHEMLSNARQRGDNRQEAYSLWRIGSLHNERGEYDEARRFLTEARDRFEAEGLEDYRVFTMLDLSRTYADTGDLGRAIEFSADVAERGPKDLRWRALVNIGGLYYRQRQYDRAMQSFADAAGALEDIDDQQRQAEAIPFIMGSLADVAKDTGHYDAALALWTRTLAQATEEKRPEVFLESLLNVAECCQVMGKISEARQKLEQAVILASFLFDDVSRLSVARALLADVMVALGSLEEAKDNARSALRLATRSGGTRGTILSSLALAETCLLSGQYADALAHADEAIQESTRARRPQDQAQGRNCRARICLQMTAGDEMNGWLTEAIEEARRALRIAERIDAGREQVVAHLTLAQCYQRQGDEAAAEAEAQRAIEISQGGAVGLNALLGEGRENLPDLLRSPDLDIERLFAGRSLNVPALEWQAYYLQGTLRAKTLGPAAAFEAMRDAARAVTRLLSGLSGDDAVRFCRHHPQIADLYADLTRYAITEADRIEARALLQGSRGMGLGGVLDLPALAGDQAD